MAATIKCANKKDLFIDVSLQTGLYTRTNVKSKGGNKETAGASAEVAVRVLIDGNLAAPGHVIFASRVQELSAMLEGMIADCLTTIMGPEDPDYGKVILDPNCVTAEEIQLVLNTTSANSFNFIAEDLEPGIHEVVVQAKIITATYVEIDGEADVEALTTLEDVDATATIGMGSVTIEEVRSIKNDTITELGL